MMSLSELAGRTEQAPGADYALDFDIAHSIEWAPIGCSYNDACTHWYGKDRAFGLPAYTASLDAAMTLVPEGWSVSIIRTAGRRFGNANLYWFRGANTIPAKRIHGAGQTPALALCAAALRALASVDTLPKGQDAKQGLAGTESGAVPKADAQGASHE